MFYFPLPQDASISGFGMWIGNDLVEADVVEKQRAREIYETILREKKDPGLLEWTGGNLFKARVFPIEGPSEKRIKIVYTQVLPLRANKYRYSYGLRSELLRTDAAARAVAYGAGEFGAAAQERDVPDASGSSAADAALRAAGFRGPGIHAEPRLRSGLRNRESHVRRRRGFRIAAATTAIFCCN